MCTRPPYLLVLMSSSMMSRMKSEGVACSDTVKSFSPKADDLWPSSWNRDGLARTNCQSLRLMYSLRTGFVKDGVALEGCLGLSTTADARMETIARRSSSCIGGLFTEKHEYRERQSEVRSQPDRVSAYREYQDRSVQLAVRPAHGRQVHRSHRGHRSVTQGRGCGGADTREPALAGLGLG